MAVLKLTVVLLCVVSTSLVGVTTAGRLLRVPRVYNALITTNQKLEPSRVYSVSAPVVPIVPAVPFVYGSPYVPIQPLYPPPREGKALEETPEAEATTPASTEEAGRTEGSAEEEPVTEVEGAPEKAEEATPSPQSLNSQQVPYAPIVSSPILSSFGIPFYSYYTPYSYYPSVLPYSGYPYDLSHSLTFALPYSPLSVRDGRVPKYASVGAPEPPNTPYGLVKNNKPESDVPDVPPPPVPVSMPKSPR